MKRSRVAPLFCWTSTAAMSLTLLLAATIFCPSVAHADYWTDQEILYDNGGASMALDLATGPNGEIHVVWHAILDEWGEEQVIYHRSWRDGVWSDLFEVQYLHAIWTYLRGEQTIVCDQQGRLHVVWTQHDDGPFGGADALYYRQFNGATWGEAEVVPASGWGKAPSLCVAGDGMVYLIASEAYHDGIRYRRLEGDTWSEPVMVHETDERSTTPAIAVGSDGLIHVVWREPDAVENWKLFAKNWDGVGWSDPEILDEESTYYEPDIAAGLEGVVHLAYRVLEFGTTSSVRYRQWQDGIWSPVEQVTPDSLGVFNGSPSIAVGPSGEPHIAYEGIETTLGESGIFHVQREGSTWTEAEQVTIEEDECREPSVGLDPDGRVHVAWLYPQGFALGVGNVRYARRLIPAGLSEFVPPSARTGLVGTPNPFRSEVQLRIDPGSVGLVEARIFDATGRLIRTLSTTGTGSAQTILWDGKDQDGRFVPPGVYLYRVSTGEGEALTGRVVRIR